MSIVNTSLIKSPYNWATVAIMALFGLVLLSIIWPEPSNS